MQVDKIEIGTVIDHIPSGLALKLLKILELDSFQTHRAAFVLNVPSKKMGTKDIVKIEGRTFPSEVLNTLSLLAPKITVNIISGGKITKKFFPKPPNQIERIAMCPNPNCISLENHSLFNFENKTNYRCAFCDRIYPFVSLFK